MKKILSILAVSFLMMGMVACDVIDEQDYIKIMAVQHLLYNQVNQVNQVRQVRQVTSQHLNVFFWKTIQVLDATTVQLLVK